MFQFQMIPNETLIYTHIYMHTVYIHTYMYTEEREDEQNIRGFNVTKGVLGSTTCLSIYTTFKIVIIV